MVAEVGRRRLLSGQFAALANGAFDPVAMPCHAMSCWVRPMPAASDAESGPGPDPVCWSGVGAVMRVMCVKLVQEEGPWP